MNGYFTLLLDSFARPLLQRAEIIPQYCGKCDLKAGLREKANSIEFYCKTAH